ncbi:MAG TPA: ABC transporter substrate-binding protein [Acidobacteriota bacterium]|nr:ABC transporter substrate-binding protein [Acidobacteriota bacterium]
MRKIWTVAGLLVLTACVGSQTSDTRPDRQSFPIPEDALTVQTEGILGGTLKYPLQRDPATFNIVGAQDTRSRLISGLFTATLLELDRVSQTPSPGVVREWLWSEDGLTLDLTLRRGLKFSDGEPIDIDDLIFSLNKILEPASVTSLRSSLLFEGQSIEVEAVDEWTARLNLARPDASFESFLANWPLLPKHRFGDAGQAIETYWTLETPLEELTGAGPFRIDEYVPSSHMLLRRNPHYWKVDSQGRRLPYLDAIRISFISEIDQQALRLRNGELDLIDHALLPDLFRQLQQDSSLTAFNAGPSGDLVLFWFNFNLDTEPPPGSPFLSAAKKRWFADFSFRRAVDLAINRRQVAEVAFDGQAQPARGIASNETWIAPSLQETMQDLEKARRLLTRAGFRLDENGVLTDSQGVAVELELTALDTPTTLTTASMLQQDLQALGIQVNINRQELRAVASRVMGSRLYDVAVAIFSIPLEPSELSNVLFSSSQMHLWHPLQAEPATEWERQIDQLMSAQRAASNLEERQQMIYRAQELLHQQKVLLPIVQRDQLIAHVPALRNIKPTKPSPGVLWNAWEIFFAQP